uniref:MgtC/SapB family protein n=1 Tax=uncultured Draconibacterium sp. TaxID=1573823 RepID=UPI003217C616
MDYVFDITPLDFKGCLISILCGFIIGFERQWNGKPAGIRTSILICLGAYTFVAIGNYYQPSVGSVRLVGQIVTGVGFMGGGVILTREGLVQGVTSAAIIWLLAGIGSLCGLHHYITALWLTGFAISVLLGITVFENLIAQLNRGVHRKQKK